MAETTDEMQPGELERFGRWAAGDRGRSEWTGITPEDADRDPTFQDLDERVFRAYARYLGSDRALKQNTIHTYYHYISTWCGWCANEGYLRGHYARRASAMAPLPEDDGDSNDRFGWSVALPSDGSTALIGVVRDEDPNGNFVGSAYVFE